MNTDTVHTRSALPGPRGQFPVGSYNDFAHDPLTFLLQQRHFGDLTRFYYGLYPVIVVNHPDLVHDVLVANAEKYHKRSNAKRVFAPIIGNGLVISEGDFWKHQRRLMQPAFHS